MEKTTKSVNKHRAKKIIIGLLPIAALIILFILYCSVIVAKGYRLNMYLEIMFNQAIVLAVVATGATFIYTLGSFDISLGASTLLSAAAGVLVYNRTENLWLMLLVIMAVAIGCSLLSSVLASVFNLPVFVTTVAMMSVLTALANTLITTNGGGAGSSPMISIPSAAVGSLDNVGFKIAVLAVYAALCVFVFNFLKVGRRQKFLGGNPICAKLTGISLNKYAVVAFLMAGVGVGLGAFLTLIYTPSVTASTAGGIGMQILVAIVFGGMPISGGPRSRIYAAIVGGFSYMLLNGILGIFVTGMKGGAGISQIISAIFFLAVVFITGFSYRTKNLPR